MARQTKIKINALDLDNIFAQGYVKRQGLVVTGDNWLYHKVATPILNSDITTFQLPIIVEMEGSIPKVKMSVNGVSVESSLLSIHPTASNTIVYDSSQSFKIDNDDLVEFWYPEKTSN